MGRWLFVVLALVLSGYVAHDAAVAQAPDKEVARDAAARLETSALEMREPVAEVGRGTAVLVRAKGGWKVMTLHLSQLPPPMY